ncbi:MAG: sugar phosphate isomerase/epimerase [Kiritimatiellia bacterium]|jgi:sugar phosphate isomerase/epimerase|nr:sugar phosphate isomerase/epimerase [Kiritimatiellia bacterium]MDP6631682.1 sugar phosphate isomerase/epimerase [Kiritimatiellia bacterium]MDP6810780.1 sugar phosphate isomerase/epimerase [Kiritimatiellia bacterium]MDP7022655.1 sugar phosphate isomerase/epimerase [Kiritimatiellia bacterium]
MAASISVQLYSVREQAAADYEGTMRAIAEMGFEYVEPAGYPGSSPAEAAKLFNALGLKAVSCHGALPVGAEKNRVIEEALMLGHKYVITGCPPDFKENYASADAVRAMVDLYCEAAQNADPHGLRVGYHNHDWDLVEIDGKRGYRYFLEGTPETVLWEADLFWVARAGLDPAEFVKEIGTRGICLHFKDGIVTAEGEFTEAETEDGKIMVSDSTPFLPAGAGQVDLLGAYAVAEHLEYAVVELDSYEGDMMKAVQESYTYLTTKGIAQGRK